MKMPGILIVGAIAAFALLASACAGDTVVHTEGSTAAGISVTGTGKAYGAPDVANLQIGVSNEANTVSAAREGAARSLQAVIESIRRNGVDQKDIRTTHFSVEPQYDFTGRTQVLRGYRVTNVLNVTVRNVDTTGKVIDDALAAGGDAAVVRGISFTVSNPEKLQEAARADAMREAKSRAEELARLGGVGLGRPISIIEGVRAPDVPFPSLARSAVQEADTPIEPGELEITVSVTVLYAIDR
jgi:uncharacterized protein